MTKINQPKKAKVPILLDPMLVFLVLLFSLIGLIMIYSITAFQAEKNGYHVLISQVVAVCLGVLFMFVFSCMKIRNLYRYSKYMYILTIVFVLLPLCPFIGSSAGGATRWVNFGFMRFQPGEFVKLFFVIYLAGYYARHEKKIDEFKIGIFNPLLLVGVVALLFLMHPDFGSCAIIVATTLGVAYFVGARIRYIFYLALPIIPIAIYAATFKAYRLKRIQSFFDPLADPSGSGYQLVQSLVAVESGGFSGRGLGESVQKLSYLPASFTDFIYSIIAEELGFLGGFFIIILFSIFLLKCVSIAKRVAYDTFLYALSIGIILILVLPAFLNFGVVLGLLPTKGLVLTFISYGGSNIIASYIGVGILLAIVRSIYNREV